MKHLIIIMWVALALMSCASSKKATSKAEASQSTDSIATSESVAKNSFFDFDTTFTKDVGITITEVEFYPPTSNNADAMQEQCKSNANARQKKHPSHGNIKRLKQTIIGASVKSEGHTKQGDTLAVNKNNVVKRKQDTTTIKEHTSERRTFHWWYYVVIVGIVALLYLARMPILNAIRKILTGCRRIL